MKLKSLISIVLLFAGVVGHAHDFTVTVDGGKLFFEITSKTKKTAAVTYNGSISNKTPSEVKGTVTIPSAVRHDGVEYTISAIGRKAFENAPALEGVVMPSTIEKIGDFAFEGCSALKSVVFPASQPEFGQGVFFRCNALEDVSLGSDWKAVDFTMFRWSNELKSVAIPARIESIKGLRMLKGLASIAVDRNNARFSSIDGILYGKTGEDLLFCPRNYKKDIRVADSCKKVRDGALYGCVNTEYIDFPEGMENVSFRETARMERLKTIVMRNPEPIFTGYTDEQGFFFFQLANPAVEIMILKTSRDAYLAALPTAAGNYSVAPGEMAYEVQLAQLPTKKNFKEVKNFDKY